VLGAITIVLALFVVSGIIIPPLLPDLPLRQTAGDSLGRVPRSVRPAVHHTISVRAERERLASRQRLFTELKLHPAPPSERLEQIRRIPSSARPDERLANRAPGDPIVAGFYVNWDDNSFQSLKSNINTFDWIVGEWGLVRRRGRDSLPLQININHNVLALASTATKPTPQILLMLTNATGDGFDPAAVRQLITRPAFRRRAIRAIVDSVRVDSLDGVTVDFEELPAEMHPLLLGFLRDLSRALKVDHKILTQAVPGDDPSWPVREYAKIDDRIFLMLYDEHDPSDDPGPIASQQWFEQNLRRVLAEVPARQIIVGIGQYGYQWSDTSDNAIELTFEDVMQLARDHTALPMMDRESLNPTFSWDDPDSTSNIVWYLDGPTAWNEIKLAQRLGVAGIGIWRLGAEDPSIWNVLGRSGLGASPAPMDTMRAAYDVNFIGSGEILRMVAEPTLGERRMVEDTASGLVLGERVTQTPSSYVIKRYGRRKKAVALTFDDGPDPKYTPDILDTLASRGVHATFFIIGENANVHPELLRRELREGHEIGNHTYTHPNLARVSRSTTRLELDATERLIEAFVNRRTALWRPPYFGDAEPTDAAELVPVSIAQELGYITVGLHIDPGDWQTPGVDSIINGTLHQLDRGNIILLHDGGGDRSQTVAALGPLIDSIKARGYEITTVTALAGVSPAQAMARLPQGSTLRHFVELASYSLGGWIELTLRAVFLVAMILGASRLVIILALAARQRYSRRHGRRRTDLAYHPSVTVVIPAYNEEPVVCRTVQSVLDQGYAGLKVVVVDDGSPDGTSDVLRAAFGANPHVALFRKPNGGKASALNFGVERADGEIIVALDADTIFPPGTIHALVQPMADPRVGAVAGNAKVGNRINLVTRWQAIEYITSQNIDRRAFSLLNCITVVPGAIGAWRTTLVRDAGGFSSQTLAEDQDLTMTILERGYRIAYADRAAAYTEAPDNLRGLARQRFRWSFGTLQCAWKHRYALLRPRYGMFGFAGLPNIWIFQLLFPFISPVADLMFLWSLVRVYQNEVQHGPEYALQSLEQVVFFYSIFLFVDWLAAAVALLMEPEEDKKLSWLILLQRFAYRQVMYWVVVKSFFAALQGTARGWGKQERKGTVALGDVH